VLGSYPSESEAKAAVARASRALGVNAQRRGERMDGDRHAHNAAATQASTGRRSCASNASIKQDHPDAFLFFRLGDFYEMFFEDAVRGAALLGLTLTSRNKQDPDPVPMCGIPWHQRDAYVAGCCEWDTRSRSAISSRIPSVAKGIVQRGVTEVLHAGLGDGRSLSRARREQLSRGNLARRDAVGVCLADASTGEMRVLETVWDDAGDVIARLASSDGCCRRGRSGRATRASLAALLRGARARRARCRSRRFAITSCSRGAGARVHRRARGSARGAAAPRRRWTISTACRWRRAAAATAASCRGRRGAALRRRDRATPRAVRACTGGEAAHTLWHHVNLRSARAGRGDLRQWLERPLVRPARSRRGSMRSRPGCARRRAAPRFAQALAARPDLERLGASRVRQGDAARSRRDARRAAPIARAGCRARRGRGRRSLAGVPALEARLAGRADRRSAGRLARGRHRADGLRRDRDALDDLAHSGKRWIAELEASERARTGISTLKVGYKPRVRLLPGSHAAPSRPRAARTTSGRQTLSAAERFVDAGAQVKEGEVLWRRGEAQGARARAVRSAARVHAGSSGAARDADTLSRLDAESALAEAAVRYAWTRPVVDDSDRAVARRRAPSVVERLVAARRVRAECARAPRLAPPDHPAHRARTWAARARTCARSRCRAARAGRLVRARRRARIGRVDRLFTRVGAADRLGAGRARSWSRCRRPRDPAPATRARSCCSTSSGRGTATYDGLALAGP
jgi:DNA mismatch repair protein MutS